MRSGRPDRTRRMNWNLADEDPVAPGQPLTLQLY